MSYRYRAFSVGGLIQQLAVCYVQRGYWFYVIGQIPKGKNYRLIDRKILSQYQIEMSKFQRYRLKKKGLANVQYLRYRNTFVLLATQGEHLFFSEEQNALRDVRESPMRLFGYTITYKNGRVLVGLDEETYRNLKTAFLRLALRRTSDALGWKLKTLPFEPYRPVYRQVLAICKTVNRKRKTAGLPLLPYSAIRRKRRSYRPFDGE
jgi:hypothetical protein